MAQARGPDVRLLLGALVVLVVMLWVALPAAAHTLLDESTPAAGSTASEVVSLTLVFTKPIEVLPDTIALTDGSRRLTPPASRSDDGLTVSADLASPLPEGDWRLDWRVLAEDSHPREGSFGFTVAGATSDAPVPGTTTATTAPEATASASGAPPSATDDLTTAPTTPPRRGPLEALASLFRILFYVGLMSAVGLALFKAGPHSGMQASSIHLARTTAAAAAVGLVAGVLEVVVHVSVVSGQGPAGAFDPASWRAVMATGLGTALWLRVAGLTVILLGSVRRARVGIPSGPDPATLLGAALAISSFQLVGHTASAAPAWIVRSADAAHALAAAVWIGGLLGLAIVSRRGTPRSRRVTVARFSTWATGAVVGVAVAGAALAITNLPDIAAAWTSGYGRLLIAKLAVVAVLGAIGAHNHLRVVPAIVAGDDRAVAVLDRSVRVEIGLVLVVLALTALLVNTSPV